MRIPVKFLHWWKGKVCETQSVAFLKKPTSIQTPENKGESSTQPFCVPFNIKKFSQLAFCSPSLSTLCFPLPADHRHSSHHIHRPLSKLPLEGRRKKSSKKRRKDKDHKSSHAPSSGPIEEGEDEEEEEEEDATTDSTSAPADSEKAKDVEVINLTYCCFEGVYTKKRLTVIVIVNKQ